MTKLNLTTLIKQYKQTPTDKIFSEINKQLKSFITEKAKYIYRKKIKIGDRYFSIADSSYEIEDVKQDLYTEILRIIKDYDCIRDFNVYLISSLWYYKPHFVTKEFIKEIGCDSIDEKEDLVGGTIENSFFVEDVLSYCRSEMERKVLSAYLEDFAVKQETLAKRFGVTQQYISLVVLGLQKQLKKYLKNTC